MKKGKELRTILNKLQRGDVTLNTAYDEITLLFAEQLNETPLGKLALPLDVFDFDEDYYKHTIDQISDHLAERKTNQGFTPEYIEELKAKSGKGGVIVHGDVWGEGEAVLPKNKFIHRTPKNGAPDFVVVDDVSDEKITSNLKSKSAIERLKEVAKEGINHVKVIDTDDPDVKHLIEVDEDGNTIDIIR